MSRIPYGSSWFALHEHDLTSEPSFCKPNGGGGQAKERGIQPIQILAPSR
jgi:hypothetical protein